MIASTNCSAQNIPPKAWETVVRIAARMDFAQSPEKNLTIRVFFKKNCSKYFCLNVLVSGLFSSFYILIGSLSFWTGRKLEN